MAVAARWPERVSGLLICGASGEPDGLRALAYRALAAVFRTVPVSWLDATNRWYFARRYPAVAADPLLAGGFWFRGGAVAVASLVGERFRPRLAAYPGPTLVVNGELDLFFRPTARSFVDVAADARSVVIRRATHLVNLDQPEAFVAVTRRFARDAALAAAEAPAAAEAAAAEVIDAGRSATLGG